MKRGLMVSSEYIKKYAFDFKGFNKFAAGEGLKYMSAEFKEIDAEIAQMHSHNFKSFKDNKRIVSDVNTLRLIHDFLTKFRFYLDNYYKTSKELFDNFKRSIVKNDKSALVKTFGKDYMQYLEDIFPGRGLAGGYKYKALMEFVGGKDRDLMEQALDCIGKNMVSYADKYQEISLYFNKIFGKQKDPLGEYSWLTKYEDLFKFAAKPPSFFDISHLFPGRGQSVEFGEESLEIKLKDSEKKMLQDIVDLFNNFKATVDKFLPLLERAYAIDKGYLAVEETRKEMLESIFDRIRALKYMINSYVADNGTEGDFYNDTGMTFRNAFSKLDRWVYSLITVFPSEISSSIAKNYLKKMPRKYYEKDQPNFEVAEEAFFEKGKEYEAGERSGITEDESGDEVLNFQEKEQFPVNPRRYRQPSSWNFSPRSFVGADYNEAINIVKKSAK